MNTDPIADLLTRLRNAFAAGKEYTTVPYSKLKMKILEICQKYGFIEKAKLIQQKNKKDIKIILSKKYHTLNLKRISKPGCRVFKKASNMRTILEGYGICIVSTSKGLLTSEEAKERNIGGEVICEIF